MLNEARQKVQEFVARFKAAKSDGKIEFAEAVELVMLAADDVVSVLKQFTAPGADKRKAAQEALDEVIDMVVAYDIPQVPNFVEISLVDPTTRILLRYVRDAAIEFAVKKLGSNPAEPTGAAA